MSQQVRPPLTPERKETTCPRENVRRNDRGGVGHYGWKVGHPRRADKLLGHNRDAAWPHGRVQKPRAL